MSAIFISHSSSDNVLAKSVERRLDLRHHHSVFLDLHPEKRIVAGQSWERTLYRKLRACLAVIALCTDDYLRSQWCFAEIALVRMEGKPVIALLANPLDDGAAMPGILMERQVIDLRGTMRRASPLVARGRGARTGRRDHRLGPKRTALPRPPCLSGGARPVFFGRFASRISANPRPKPGGRTKRASTNMVGSER